MLKYFSIFLVAVTLTLVGCGTPAGLIKDGGSANATISWVVENPQPDGTIQKETNTVQVNAQQPQNPTGGNGLRISKKKDGSFDIVSNPGASTDNTDDILSFDLVKMVWIFAGILIVAGLIVGFALKNYIWAIVLGLTGISMGILAYLLVQYAAYFLLGIGVLFLFGCYLAYKHFYVKRALTQTVKLVDVAKESGIIDEEKFHKLAKIDNSIQNEKTQKIVDKIRGK